MGKLGFYYDMSLCIGCRTCQIACKDKNNLEVGTLYRQVRNYEVGDAVGSGSYFYASTCNHCENPTTAPCSMTTRSASAASTA